MVVTGMGFILGGELGGGLGYCVPLISPSSVPRQVCPWPQLGPQCCRSGRGRATDFVIGSSVALPNLLLRNESQPKSPLRSERFEQWFRAEPEASADRVQCCRNVYGGFALALNLDVERAVFVKFVNGQIDCPAVSSYRYPPLHHLHSSCVYAGASQSPPAVRFRALHCCCSIILCDRVPHRLNRQ